MGTTVKWLLACVAVLAASNSIYAQGRSPRAQPSTAQQRETRAAARIARQAESRVARGGRRDGQEVREGRRQSTEDHGANRRDRRLPERPHQGHEFGHDVALRQQLAEVDRLRDRALLTGDDALLDRADAMEAEIHDRFARMEAHVRGGEQEFGRFTTGAIEPSATGDVESLPPVQEIERGLGRETARQVRGLEPLAEGEVELGAPGFGRRTAAERRYLRGDAPRGPWDAQYWPNPQVPPPAEGEPLPETQPEPLPEVTEPPTENLSP